MSREGWQSFLAAGHDDWVVLHGGATAVFRTASAADAASLASAMIAGVDPAPVVLTINGAALSVRLTRDVWELSSAHVSLAEQVPGIARSAGAVADRSAVQEVQLAIAARPDDVDLPFWQAVLGYAQTADDSVADPLGHGSTVWIAAIVWAMIAGTAALRP